MKCSWCKKDKSYWDMTVLPLTEEQKTYPITPAKDVVCDRCLGLEIKSGDNFTFDHPDYPDSSLKGKEMIAGEVTEEYIERFEQGSLSYRRYPKKYCKKVG